MPQLGMITVKNNAQMEQEEKAERVTQAISLSGDTVETEFAAYVKKCWESARGAKRDVETQMLKNLRQRQGQYEPERLNAIKSMRGSEVFIMITDTKCRNAEAWLREIYFGQKRCWNIEPTPVPELPPELEQGYMKNFIKESMLYILIKAIQSGQQIDFYTIMDMIKQQMPDYKMKLQKMMFKQAKIRAEYMSMEIDDQLFEGNFYKALNDCIPDLVTLPAAIIKGPIFRNDKLSKIYTDPRDGHLFRKIETRLIPTYQRRDPLDIYPAPDSNDIDDGYLIDHIRITPHALSELIGVPGYNESAIREVLQTYKTGGLREWTGIESERATVEGKPSQSVFDSDKLSCLEMWGSVQGEVLHQWDKNIKKNAPDKDIYYNITGWMIGRWMIGCEINPDPMGRKPYGKASFEETPGSFWGKGVPQLISDVQTICNACARAVVNNVGVASGPQVERNISRIPVGETKEIYPWKVWDVTDDQLSGNAPALQFYQPPMVVDKLLNVYSHFSKIADEHSGIPAYAHGDTNVGGGGNTASGLSMLITQSSRGIKGVVRNGDRGLIENPVTRQYTWNIEQKMMFGVVGDLKVRAQGSQWIVEMQEHAIRLSEFAQVTNNPTDLQIMGLEGRRNLLREAGQSLQIDVDNIIPTEALKPMDGMMMPAGQQPPVSGGGQTLDAAGRPAQGTDYMMFNRGGGQGAPA